MLVLTIAHFCDYYHHRRDEHDENEDEFHLDDGRCDNQYHLA